MNPIAKLYLLLTFSLSTSLLGISPAPDGGYPGGNTAEGDGSLLNITTGVSNTAIGINAMQSILIGGNNTGVGNSVLFNSTGNDNTAIGSNAGVNISTGDNNIDIGSGQRGTATDATTTRIGVEGTQTAAFIAGINGVALTNPLPVVIDVNGQLGVGPSITGFPQGGILLEHQGFAAPVGFTKIGTFKFKYDNLSGVSVTITLDVYQKD